jgi:hypothetical protein
VGLGGFCAGRGAGLAPPDFCSPGCDGRKRSAMAPIASKRNPRVVEPLLADRDIARFPMSLLQRRPLDISHYIGYMQPISFTEGPFARVLSEVERGRSPRAGLRPAPGRLRASFTPVLRPVREVLSLDWDRCRRVTPGESKSQEAWPGVEPLGVKPLARAAVERREASASRRTRAVPLLCPLPQAGRMKVGARSVAGCVFRRSASLLFGVCSLQPG